MPNAIPEGIRREHILAAIEDLRVGVTHAFGESTRYDLVFEGGRYPPKAVVGLAAGKLLGSPLGPYDFKGGSETKCFRVLTENGFSIESKLKTYWWTSKPDERFWCEITDRPLDEVGNNLYCPQLDRSATPKTFWSYSLIQAIQPGDIVFHYYSPDRAIIGASVASAALSEEPTTWAPHSTGEKPSGGLNEKAQSRPGWKLMLKEFTSLESPLTLSEIRESDAFVREQTAQISANSTPYIFLQMYPGGLRAVQGGYVAKIPASFVSHWKKLADAANGITSLSAEPRKVVFADESTAEAVVVDLLEQVEAKKQVGSDRQGFAVDPAFRKAIEDYAVAKAKEYFDHKGFSEIVDVGKPYDLLCFRNKSEGLYVEVKGTTTSGDKIILTYNEVEHAERNSASTALYILSGINSALIDGKWKASGGIERVVWPWQIERKRLKPLAFQYEVWPTR